MAVAKLYPYKVGQRVLWRGKIGTEGKVSTFRPVKIGQRVRLRGKDCNGKIAYGRIYKAGQRAMGRAAYLDCDPIPPGDPGSCFGCNFQSIPTTKSVTIAGFRSKVGADPRLPCCPCLGQWERLNGTFELVHGNLGLCGWQRVNDSNLTVLLSCCCGCSSNYDRVAFSLNGFNVTANSYQYAFFIAFQCAGFGCTGNTAFLEYTGPIRPCGPYLNSSGTFTFTRAYIGAGTPFNPSDNLCLSSYPLSVEIG